MSPAGSSQDGGGSPSLAEKLVAIDAALASARVPHALGGAIALAYYAEPRATIDLDLNVFLPTEEWPRVRDALAPLGVDASVDEQALARDGQVRLWWGRTPVDLFFSYDPFHDEMRKAVRRVPFAETTIPILSPEHLTVCKAVFDRPKDWLDIEQILIATRPLDPAEIQEWLIAIVGEGDERVKRLREIEESLG